MPQMMPINWLMSFMFFISIFLMFNVMNYYIFLNIPQNMINKKLNFNFKNLNWKW